jgi:Cu(I)/Ag(I) efflux system membrane protein CusA/SilA
MIKKFFSRSYTQIDEQERLSIIEKSSKQVSRGVFYSTIIIITSFCRYLCLPGKKENYFIH